MRLLRDSLLLRAFLLIVILIVLSFAAAVALFRHAVLEPRAQQMAQTVVSTVNLTRAAVLSSAPEWRSALLAELQDAEGMRLRLAEGQEILKPLPEFPPEIALMAQKVREQLGAETQFASARNGEAALWVSFTIGRDDFWLGLPSERLGHPPSQMLLVWGVVALLLALAGGYLIARQVTRPLSRVARAARQLGAGTMPAPLSEQGAPEVIAVARAFNQMSSDLAANERERALVLAGISHDLRTPLARVRLAAEMTGDASLREGLVTDVEQMDAVIRQFLDYARLDESEMPVATDLPALVGELAKSFQGRAKQLILSLEALPSLNLRPLLLRRALANLLDNAIKYGGGEIVLSLQRHGNTVELSVADKGAGIPAEQREVVKRPFVRLETARSDTGGSGLGLAIVERAARLHGGEFRLESREGGGLQATLVLPLNA
jgi:two-component system osmolarity sensor histidine kinase EnvZ